MEGEWIGDWNVLAGRRVTEMQNREGDDGEEGNGPTLASILDGFARKQKCLEALYHLTRHPETRDPMLALLCTTYGSSQGGEGEGGLLYELALGLPESHAGKGMLAHLRESVRCLRYALALNGTCNATHTCSTRVLVHACVHSPMIPIAACLLIHDGKRSRHKTVSRSHANAESLVNTLVVAGTERASATHTW